METLRHGRLAGGGGLVTPNGNFLHRREVPRKSGGVLDPLLRKLIRHGSLRVIDWKGDSQTYGDGWGPRITIRIHDRGTAWRLLLNPQFETGEAFMEERLTVEEGTLRDFLDLVFRSLGLQPLSYPLRGLTEGFRTLMRRIHQHNHAARSRRNVAHHYDLSDRLYELFLDGDRQYSCGYFMTGEETLEECQEQKKRHLAAKLLLRPGDRVLDIGSGWGGLGRVGPDAGAGLRSRRDGPDALHRAARPCVTPRTECRS